MTTATLPETGMRALPRNTIIAVISFLTLVDLFAAQAILPSLATSYGASPADMGVAVNASTFGMAAAGLAVALLARRIDRRSGIWINLILLSVPTFLLSGMPDLATFTALRVLQGVFMAAAFTLTMAYIAEHGSAATTAGALAAYVTGNVASNLVGRLMSASIADHFGLAANFSAFAVLNLLGAVLVFFSLKRMAPAAADANAAAADSMTSWHSHLANPALRRGFVLGFLILFAFLGTFTYVNFVLVDAPLALSTMTLGLVYLVFLPSMITTPLAGRVAQRYGVRATLALGLATALAGAALLLSANLLPVLAGLVLVGAGTFFAQATATGFVSRTAMQDRAAASGLYLSSYYLGGLVGSAVLGQIFNIFGWPACVAGIALSLVVALLVALRIGR